MKAWLIVLRTNVGLLTTLTALTGCGGTGGGGGSTDSGPVATAQTRSALSAAAVLGERIFADTSLSASGSMACSSCHDPANGHASPFSTAIAFGGPLLDQPGTRNPPSIRYLRFNRAFAIDADGTAHGGFDLDGRAASLREQARRPFLSANETANSSVADVVARVAATPYAEEFRSVFGANIFLDSALAFDRIVFALERYQREDPDFTFDTLGVPRNADIPANVDAAYFDQGLCGPTRTDLDARTGLCGAFKVPSLRNVALRTRLFHIGRFDSLTDVVRFYVRRDANPDEFYPPDGVGGTLAFDDLPDERRANVNTTEGPYNRQPGAAPALNEAEISDLVAFLRTLTDGYRP